MKENEAIEQLQSEYLATNGTETTARVRYHNEALDTAIAALKEVQEYHDTGHTPRMVRELRRGYVDAHKTAVQYATQLDEYHDLGGFEACKAAVERTRWIPVSERLPEKYGNYLCCNEYGAYIIGCPEESELEPGRYIVDTDDCIMYDCIAWMPLLEPYRIADASKKGRQR